MSKRELVFKLRKWVDEKTFQEILRVADYIGYFRGEGSYFKINLRKALLNSYSLEDILNLLDEVGVEVDNVFIESLRSVYEESTSLSIDWDSGSGETIVHVPWSSLKYVKEGLRELGVRYRGRDDRGVFYSIKPYRIVELKKLAMEHGVSIRDPSGLLREKNISVDIGFKGVLRDYQKEALDKWVENGYRGVVALPTGAGKTVVAIASLPLLRRRTLIVTFTKEQMFQWRDMIYKFTNIPLNYVGLFYSDEKRLSPITITTYQSAHRNIGLLGKYYDLLIIDECHHLPANKFKLIAQHTVAPYRMGLSATVVREDGRHVELFPLMGGIVYHKTAYELIQQGYLASYRLYTVKVGLTRDEEREYNELYRVYKSLAQGRKFQEVLEDAKRGDETAIKALRIHSRLRMLMAKSESKIRKALEIARKELGRNSKIIIFTQFIEQAKRISEELGAYLLIGEMSSTERKRVLEKFRKCGSGVLVVTTVGDEGLDIPDADVGIIVSGTGSRRQFIQRLGRLLRPKEGKEARLYEVVLKGTADEVLARKRKKVLKESLDFDTMTP